MREVVGRSALTSVLTNGRGQVQAQTRGADAADPRQLSRRRHHRRGADPERQPAGAKSCRPIRTSRAPARTPSRLINDGQHLRNSAVNEAQGDAAKITQAAAGYQEQVVREANGEAVRFDQIYAQYRRAPAVTRERLYIQTMEDVLAHAHKVIIGAKGATAPIILPPDAFSRQPPTARRRRPHPPAGARQPGEPAMKRPWLVGLIAAVAVAAV